MNTECYPENRINRHAGNPCTDLEGFVGFLISFWVTQVTRARVGPAFVDEREKVKHAVWFLCRGHALGLTVNRGLAWSCGKTGDH